MTIMLRQMKTDSFYFIILSAFIIISLTSCSKEDELSLEDKIVGFWLGDVVQDDLGTLEITFNISKSASQSISGTWTTKDKDISICDPQIFDCDPFSCAGPMTYAETKGDVLFFAFGLSSGPCYESSIGEFKFVDDNTLQYKNTDVGNNSTITGLFTRQ